jgi:hypothetical protein
MANQLGTKNKTMWPLIMAAFLLLPAVASAQGFVIVTGDDADDSGHCEGTRCGGLYPGLFKEGIDRSRTLGSGILAIGVNGGRALSAFNSWNADSERGLQ